MKLTEQELERLLSQQAEQAGEIWERSLPEEPEPPHVFSKRFARSMRRLMWRHKHPAMCKLTKIAAILLLCIGIGAGAAFLPRGGMSDSTLEQPEQRLGPDASQGQQIQPEQPEMPSQSGGEASNTPSAGTDGTDSTAEAPAVTPDIERPGTPALPDDGSDADESPGTSSTAPDEPSGDMNSFAVTEPSYIPAGMTVVSHQQSKTEITIRYASEAGGYVVYTSRYSDAPQLSGEGEAVSVNGAKAAVFFAGEKENTLEWIDAAACYVLTGNLTKDELLHMANSTKK